MRERTGGIVTLNSPNVTLPQNVIIDNAREKCKRTEEEEFQPVVFVWLQFEELNDGVILTTFPPVVDHFVVLALRH